LISGHGDGLQCCVRAFVVAAGIDFEFQSGDGGEVDGIVFDFGGGAGGTEAPLLANDLAFFSVSDGGDAEFLGALVLGLMEFETDAADVLGLVEFEADVLGPGSADFQPSASVPRRACSKGWAGSSEEISAEARDSRSSQTSREGRGSAGWAAASTDLRMWVLRWLDAQTACGKISAPRRIREDQPHCY
jgi:hypothetical protein